MQVFPVFLGPRLIHGHMIEIEVIAMEVSWKMAGFMAGGYESWPIPLIKTIFSIRVPFRKFHILVDSEY